MPDIKKVIDNPDTNNPEIVNRALDLEGWDEERGRQNARLEFTIKRYSDHHGVTRELQDLKAGTKLLMSEA